MINSLWHFRWFISLSFLYWHLEVDNSVDIWYDDQDEEKKTYDRFTEIFQSDESIFIVYPDPQLFSSQGLKDNLSLTKPLRDLPETFFLQSVTSTERMLSPTKEDLEILSLEDQFGKNFPIPTSQLKQIKSQMMSNRLYRGNILSKDGNLNGIIMQVARMPTEEKGPLVDKVKSILNSKPLGKRIYLSGAPVLDSNFNQISQSDHRIFTTLSFGMLFILLLFLFRRFNFAFFPLLVVVTSVTLTMAVYYLVGLTMNVISNVLAPLILCIGIADSVHILTHFNLMRNQGLSRREGAKRCLNEMFLPCFLTSLTTGLGFASFISSDVVPIKHLGGFAALGIFLALVASLTLIPAYLSLSQRDPTPLKHEKSQLFSRFFCKELENSPIFVSKKSSSLRSF